MRIYHNLMQLLTAKERRQGVILLLQMVVSTTLEIIGISLVLPVIALMTNPKLLDRFSSLHSLLSSLGNPSQTSLIVGSMLLLIGFYFLKTVFMTYMIGAQTRFAYGILARLSQQLFESYLFQPWQFHLQRNSAQLTQNIMSDASIFVTNALLPLMLLLSESLVLIGVVFFLMRIQPIGTCIIMLTVLCIAKVYYSKIRHRISDWGKARQYHVGQCFQHLQQGLGGIKDAKLLGRESEFIEQFKPHNALAAHFNQRQQTVMELPRLWLELFAVIGLGILVCVMIGNGKPLDTLVPTLGLFTAAAFRLMPSMNRIMAALQNLRFGLPVIHALSKEMASLEKRPSKAQHTSLLSFHQQITLTDVSFCYEGAHENALTHIHIRIPFGASVGFIGKSGAGKSTLVDIILGLLTPDSGQVKVDDRDIQTHLRGWQDKIGYVPQTIFLNDDTLRRNVAFGLPEAAIDEESVKRAIKIAQLEEFVHSLPDGMETLVGERGVRLSGGQRQRIGIARALYHDPAVLVLDEATSSLDTGTEKEVMKAVNALHGNKTLIIVAHRLSTVADCDFLYRLEHGKVVEETNLTLC